MRLTFSIDIPLKNPEELIDLEELSKNENTGFTILKDGSTQNTNYSKSSHTFLTDQSRLLSAVVLSRKQEIDGLINRIKSKNPSSLISEHKFPDAFGIRYPDHLAEYQQSQIRFNSIHNETFSLIDLVNDLLDNTINLSQLNKSLLENGLLEIKKQNQIIEELKIKAEEFKLISEEKEQKIKTDFSEKMRDLENRFDKVEFMCNEKDVVISDLQNNIGNVQNKSHEFETQLQQLIFQTETKYKNSEELSKYVTAILKDKKQLSETLDKTSKEVAELQIAFEKKEEDVKTTLQKNKEKFEVEIEIAKRKFDLEILKLKNKETL